MSSSSRDLFDALESQFWGDAKLIVRQEAAFARERNADLELPLHIVARRGDASEILFSCVEDLLDVFPDASECEDVHGHFPVEVLGSKEDDVVASLLPLFLGAVPRTRLRFEVSFLHHRLRWHRWQDACAAVEKNPKTVSRAFDGTYALHVATEELAPFEVLLDILMAGEDVARKTDDQARLPLHIVLQRPDMSEELLDLFLETNNRPDVLLPSLNGAIRRDDWDTVFLFLKVCPEVLQERDTRGRLPLHVLCGESGNKFDVCKTFIKIFPDAARERNPDDDRLPIHQVAARNNWHSSDE